jgi:hypothetical protein
MVPSNHTQLGRGTPLRIRKGPEYFLKKVLGVNRRAQISHITREYRVKVRKELLTPKPYFERILIGFFDLATKLAFEGGHQFIGRAWKSQTHVNFIGPFVVKSWVLETTLMAKLQVLDVQVVGKLDSQID